MILWFRNDLRVHDNPALVHALTHKVTKAVFLLPTTQWQNHHLAPIKADFILRHIDLLKVQLDALGIDLIVEQVTDFDSQIDWLVNYCQRHDIKQIIVNQELEINENNRDRKLQHKGMQLVSFEADVIAPKGSVVNQSGEMYKVFTPFKRAWLHFIKEHGFEYINKARLTALENVPELKITSFAERVKNTSYSLICSEKWPLVSQVEQQVVPNFLSSTIAMYHQHRDFPALKGTSGLSPYLAIGAMSARYLLALLLNKYPDLLNQSPEAEFTWLNELIWREFYRHLLWHYPNLAKGDCFNLKYQHLPWPNKPEYFHAWCQAKTGYPIVDAAMRQLTQTGWMHNRLRMIVASFLTKHLLVDWHLGERFFIEHLIDGDLAANNGGWQWAASTGCDAQPYFRIFNPIRQSEKFDPLGQFIRKYLPELADVPDKYIHFPHDYIKKANLSCYWPAIVEHKSARQAALDFYKVG